MATNTPTEQEQATALERAAQFVVESRNADACAALDRAIDELDAALRENPMPDNEKYERLDFAVQVFIERSLTASGGQPCMHPDDFDALKAEFDAIREGYKYTEVDGSLYRHCECGKCSWDWDDDNYLVCGVCGVAYPEPTITVVTHPKENPDV